MDYEKLIKKIMIASRDMTTEEKKHLRNLMVSAAGDLDILIFLSGVKED